MSNAQRGFSMKKVLCILAVLALSIGIVSAQEFKLSAGGGLGLESQNIGSKYSISAEETEFITSSTFLSFGVFFDATYALLTVEYAAQLGKSRAKSIATKPNSITVETDSELNLGYLDIGLVGKYPFTLSKEINIFPLLGFEYDINVAMKDKNNLSAERKADLDEFYLLLGVGADFYLSKNLYLRPIVDFGINLTAAPKTTAANTTYWGNKVDVGVYLGYVF